MPLLYSSLLFSVINNLSFHSFHCEDVNQMRYSSVKLLNNQRKFKIMSEDHFELSGSWRVLNHVNTCN